MRVTCKNCGGQHPSYDCRSRPSVQDAKASTGNADSGKPLTQTQPAPKPKMGRPVIHPDRKAYRAEWMRQWRRGEVGNKHRKTEKTDG